MRAPAVPPSHLLTGPVGSVVEGLDFDALLGAVAPHRRPWLQRSVAAVAGGAWRWLRRAPQRAAAWGAGPDGAWCAW